MTGINPELSPNSYDDSDKVEEFENFSLFRAKIYLADGNYLEDGYAVVYHRDGVVQGWFGNFPVALNFCIQAEQALEYLAAYRVAKESDANTEGLLDGAFDPGDEVH